MVSGHELGLAGSLFQSDGSDLPVVHGHHAAVLLVYHKLCSGSAELGSQNSVIGAGRAAALIVTGNGHAGLLTGKLLKLSCKGVGHGGMVGSLLLAAAGFLVQLLVLLGNGTLGAGDDGEAAAGCIALLDKGFQLVDIIRNFGDEDDIGAAGDASRRRGP